MSLGRLLLRIVLLSQLASLSLLSHPLTHPLSQGQQLDPTDFFKGSQHRPKLEIIHPENGQVLNDITLDIKIAITGYELPSHFHDSSICIAISTGSSEVGEQCFDQSADLSFHITGLSPGFTYSIRVLFLERGKTIAMSVRSFRVAGIVGVLDDPEQAVSIETALQVAVKHQVKGLHIQAEKIYRNILTENPHHATALHLLGVVFIQKGEHSQAIPYIEQALHSNSTFEDFHNNLGECYRVLGRISEAQEEFQKALKLNPGLFTALYNLGLIYQQNFRQLDRAIASYRQVLELESRNPGTVPRDTLREIKIRECDLIETMEMNGEFPPGQEEDELECWLEGLQMFPDSSTISNELGNTYVERGLLKEAFEMYTLAASLGLFIAELNKANVLEIQGFTAEARASFEETLVKAETQSLPSFHVSVRMATVTPRILPSTDYELKDIRNTIERDMDKLLSSPAPRNIDNAPPTNYGFSTGFYWAYHGHGNLNLKSKMYRLYLLYCPALSRGYFIDPVTGTHNASPDSDDIQDESTDTAIAQARNVADSANAEGWGFIDDHTQLFDGTGQSDQTFNSTDNHSLALESTSENGTRLIRIGFASRYFFIHPVGIMYERVIKELSQAGHLVYLFFIDGYYAPENDAVSQAIRSYAHKVLVPLADVSVFVKTVRDEELDVLIYTDLGLDPVPFFSAFARLAPIQVTTLGFPDTSGMASVNYFISGDIEISNAELSYSETLIKMPHMGVCFEDRYFDYAVTLQNHRTMLLERAKYIESIGVPRAAHLYVIGQPLYVMHPSFDEVITRILLQDKLAYVIFLDRPGKTSWQNLFRNRLIGKFSEETSKRLFFHTDLSNAGYFKAIAAAHVVLDPFPSSDYTPSFYALAIGVPVITMPSRRIIGRMTYSLYRTIGYEGLVVKTALEYSTLALSIAHKPKERAMHSEKIMSSRHLLFDCFHVVSNWNQFFRRAVAESKHPRLRKQTLIVPE